MTKSERMKPVVRVAESREETAARAFSEAQRTLEAQKQRLQELIRYRGDYQYRFQEAGRTGLSGAQVQQMQRFLGQLDFAIEQQQRVIVTAEHTCEQSRRSWNAARGKKEALNKVVGRYRRQEQHDDARREQKEMDEFAQQKGRNSR